MVRLKACKSCGEIDEKGKICPKCGNKGLTTFWQGKIYVLKPESSEIARKKKIEKPGKYALRLSV